MQGQYYIPPSPYKGEEDEEVQPEAKGYTPDTIDESIDVLKSIRDACHRG